MPDSHIDHGEVQVYGPHACRQAERLLFGLPPSFDAALTDAFGTLGTCQQTHAKARQASASATAAISVARTDTTPAAQAAWAGLTELSSHLGSHRKDSVVRTEFFPTDGTPSGQGRSRGDLEATLVFVVSQLASPDRESNVREADFRTARLKGLLEDLAPKVARSRDAHDDRSEASPEARAARSAWLRAYRPAKHLAENLLILEDKLDRMPRVFHDLTVPRDAKVTAPSTLQTARCGRATALRLSRLALPEVARRVDSVDRPLLARTASRTRSGSPPICPCSSAVLSGRASETGPAALHPARPPSYETFTVGGPYGIVRPWVPRSTLLIPISSRATTNSACSRPAPLQTSRRFMTGPWRGCERRSLASAARCSMNSRHIGHREARPCD